jgi:1-acyl-sn-glycerol-3-phosphate acyltransferase
MKHAGTVLVRWIYGTSAWIIFLVFALTTVLIAMILPGEKNRRRLTRAAARTVFTILGARPKTSGLQHLPSEPCVVVANHASYLDGIILHAVLPERFCFVIKSEMSGVPVAGFLLRRIGAQFVERFDARKGARDMRRLIGISQSGASIAFFPEGTFEKEAGLRRFRSGAFAAAISGGLPLVPVAIRGSRQMLPSGRNLPVPGRLEVEILPPVYHEQGEGDKKQLAAACRNSILEVLGEPDLTAK